LHQSLAGNELLDDACVRVVRERHLGGLGSAHKPRERVPVALQVDAMLRLKQVRNVLDDHRVEVVASQTGVAVRGAHLDDTLAQLYDRNVEGAPTKIVDGDLLILFSIQSISE